MATDTAELLLTPTHDPEAAAEADVQEIVARQIAMMETHAALMQQQLELMRGTAARLQPAARPGVAEALSGIWAEVLGRDRVGARESFFELGGHSLAAARIASRVRASLAVEITVRDVFEAPTVAELAERVNAPGGTPAPRLSPVEPADRSRPLPLSFAQERLWFLERMDPGSGLYHLPSALRLEGELDVAALEHALGEIVRRHEVLRATFAERDGRPVQAITPFAGFALPVDDLSDLPRGEREAEVRALAAEDAARGFDLSTGPLLRARLLRLGEREHVLLLCLHQIAADGWSLCVLFRELSTLYWAARHGRDGALGDLPVQYADYAAWQRAQLHGDGLERRLAWWKERLSGAPELMDLPTDRPRPAVQSFRGAHEPLGLSLEMLERLRALARREGVSLYMVLLAAFQVLLSRYTGGDDVVVGGTAAGRPRGELEGLMGPFTYTLVLRTDLSGDPAFTQVLRRVREVALGAYEHQDVPFARLVDTLHPERSLSHSPIFQVLFELDDGGALDGCLPGVGVRPVETSADAARYDLALRLTARSHGLAGGITYATDLFDRGTARRMVEHLERVLVQVIDRPDARLSSLDLMGRVERTRVLGWNRTVAKQPAGRCIHHLFEEQARLTPNAVAAVCGDESLTYRELDERANRLAHHLRSLGVGPEVRVALLLERRLEMMVSLLGVLKAGGAYVPLDPGYPAGRLEYMLDDSAVAVLLTHDALRQTLPERDGMAVVCVDAGWPRISAHPAHAPESGVAGENLAYVIYTSGSTGRPKGVAMHHRGVCNYIHWGVRAYGAGQGSGAPLFSSLAVDLTVTSLLPLFAGRPVHLLPGANPVEALAQALRGAPKYGLIKITPIHLALLTPLLTPGQARDAAHTLVVGADTLVAEPTLFWQEHAPGVRLMNEYGPTETVVGCSAYVLPRGRHRAGPVPVGRPIQNMRFYVLDAHLQPVPVGLPGELYVGGAGVARGYLDRPSLTAQAFVPDPFGDAGARMYRTGDRARWLADGNLLFLGRGDSQVKVRGFRVELGEIEGVLRRHPSVAECAVVVREDRAGDRRLVAYVTGDAGADDASALRGHLQRTLPEYMVPAAFVRLHRLPHSATGKLDARALPAPEYALAEERYVAPRTAVEAALAEMWADVLGRPRVSLEDNFFALGGHSLLIMSLAARVRDAFRADLPVRALFSAPTLQAMAADVERSMADQRETAAAD